jgi:hypothetical protein
LGYEVEDTIKESNGEMTMVTVKRQEKINAREGYLLTAVINDSRQLKA